VSVPRKYVEVLYKCKPASFRSRVVCGGEAVALACPPALPDSRWGSAVQCSAEGGRHCSAVLRAGDSAVPCSAVQC
jgi:hypothetical protein